MAEKNIYEDGLRPTGEFTTDQLGKPVQSDAHSLTSGGPDGVIALHDTYVVEKLAAFDRERVPERVVHAKGGGAFGELEITEDVSEYTRAAVFQKGTKTPTMASLGKVLDALGAPLQRLDEQGLAGELRAKLVVQVAPQTAALLFARAYQARA